MAKPKKAAARTHRTWTPKTTTPKQRRSGINAKQHHRIPVVRLQTPTPTRVPFTVESTMRVAFMEAEVPEKGTKLVGRIIRSLKRGRGTFNVQGWRVINRRGKRGKRRR